MNNGYIKLFRSFRDWYGYGNSKRVALWVELLLRATHQDQDFLFNGEPIRLNPGQFVTGRKKLSQATGISEAYIEDLLNEFEKQGQIRQQKSNTSRLVTIVKWEDYQCCDNGVTTERQRTDNGPTTDRHIQEGKEGKNEKKVGVGAFAPPTLDEVKAYCTERKNWVDPNKWHDFYTAKGWMVGKNRMKDWRAAVRTWERNSDAKRPAEPRDPEQQRILDRMNEAAERKKT